MDHNNQREPARAIICIIAVLLILTSLNYTAMVLSGSSENITLMGNRFYAIGTDSFEPELEKGSVCIAKEPGREIKKGDLIIYTMNMGTGKQCKVISKVIGRDENALAVETKKFTQSFVNSSSVDCVIHEVIKIPYAVSSFLFSITGLVAINIVLLGIAALILIRRKTSGHNGENQRENL